MKKITIAAMLLAAAIAFTSCGNPAGSGAGNQNNTGSGDSGSGDAGSGDSNTTTVTFDDCTTTITKDQIELSDGNWGVKKIDLFEYITNTSETVASVTDGNYTFISGKLTTTFDLTDAMTADQITAFNQLSQAEKEQQISQLNTHFMHFTNVTTNINGTNVSIVSNGSASELAQLSNQFTLSTLPSTATIKTNSNKTKYTFSYTETYGNDTLNVSWFINKL